FLAAVALLDGLKRHIDRPVGEVPPVNHVGNAVQYNRAACLKQNLIIVGIELTDSKAATGCKPTKRIGEPARQDRDVVERLHPSVDGLNKEVTVFTRKRS